MNKKYYEAHFSTDEGLTDLLNMVIIYRNEIYSKGEYYISHIVIDNDEVLCQASVIINQLIKPKGRVV
jgi:hypothetical protein